MSKRLRFGLDIDGVIYDWFGAYRFLANHYLNANLPPVEQIWDGTRTDADFLTADQQRWMWTEGVQRGLFRYGHIHKGSVEALRTISAFADIVVITHRPTSWHTEVPEESRRKGIKDTLAWLNLLAEDVPFVEVHILDKSVPKSSVSCDAYLDDSVFVIHDLRTTTKALVMLWERPWNRNVNWSQHLVSVVSDWAKVIALLEAKAGLDRHRTVF